MNKRRHQRLDINHPAIVHYRRKSYPHCHILNFSEGGLYLQSGENELLQQFEHGFHQHSSRPQALIELEGAQHAVSVEVVYVNQAGIGIAFGAPEKELYEYLLEYTQTAAEIPDAPVPSITQANPATKSILERLRSKTLEYLKSQFDGFPVIAKEDLIAATDDSKGSGEQSDLFFTITTLERQAAQINHDFFVRVEIGFNGLIEEKKTETAVKEKSLGQELELVDKEDFDEWILLNDIAHRMESRLSKPTYNLDLSLSRLLQRPIKSETNPLSPISLLTRLKESLEIYNIAQEAKQIVYQAFAKGVLNNIHRLYGEALACLEEEGIEADVKGNATHSTAAPVDVQVGESHQPTKVEESPRPKEVEEPQQPAKTLEHLSSLMNLGHIEESVETKIPEQYPVAPHEQVIDSIESMPIRNGLSILKQLEKYLRREVGEPLSLDPLTRAAIGASEELVVAVKQDDLLCSSVQALIDRLEVPFIKETINDPAMLENADHPGRHFLQAVEGLVPYCSAEEKQGQGRRTVSRGLEQLFREIEIGSLSNIAQVTQQLEELQEQQKELFERNRKLAIESFKRNEKLQQAYKLVKLSLQEILLGESVSSVIDRLFQYGWASLLIHTAMLHKQESMEWRAYVRVIDFLHKLFRSGEAFTPVSQKNTADLLMIIRKGFADYPVHPEGTDRFTVELQGALTDSSVAQKFIDARIEIDEEYLNKLFVGQVAVDLEEAATPQVRDKWRNLVQGIELDQWIVQYREAGQVRLVNLAWKNQDSGRYLLVDGNGIKVVETDINRLAQQFESNTLALMENRELQVVDRAVQRILRNTYDNIEHKVSYDELTGLMNRRAFERVLNDLLRGDSDTTDCHVLIMLDVDQFGLVNDLCGFEGGDKLLQSLTNILRNYLPPDSQLARTGDDEFAILVLESSLDQGFQVAETHRQTIDEYKYNWANQLIPVSVSLGVVEFSGKHRSSGELLKAASSACNIAKQAGKNCTRIYREDDTAFMEHKKLIKSVAGIEGALDKGRIVLVAQLIKSLQDGAAAPHYEILLRVLDEHDALQAPFHFIIAAEKYDLMRAVDRWVVKHFFDIANSQLHKLEEIGGFSINLSGQSIADNVFKNFLKKQIESSPIPRNKLGFEITETAMVKDSRDAVRFIEEIREMGCRFYLDDFGSGYASFSYLKALPVDYVKIDGIFIKDLLHDQASQTMVKSVTEISHFMGRQVVAEFVEDGETADTLKKMGVDFIQGYHIGRPVPLHEIILVDALSSNCS